MRKILHWNTLALLLGLTLSTAGYAYDGGQSGRQRARLIELQGCILAANSSAPQHSRSSHAAVSASYVLLHQNGSVVLQALGGQPPLPYHRLWLKGDDTMFDKLVAEEQLFLNVRIAGVLREYQPDTGILDLVHIEVIPFYAHEQVDGEKAKP